MMTVKRVCFVYITGFTFQSPGPNQRPHNSSLFSRVETAQEEKGKLSLSKIKTARQGNGATSDPDTGRKAGEQQQEQSARNLTLSKHSRDVTPVGLEVGGKDATDAGNKAICMSGLVCIPETQILCSPSENSSNAAEEQEAISIDCTSPGIIPDTPTDLKDAASKRKKYGGRSFLSSAAGLAYNPLNKKKSPLFHARSKHKTKAKKGCGFAASDISCIHDEPTEQVSVSAVLTDLGLGVEAQQALGIANGSKAETTTSKRSHVIDTAVRKRSLSKGESPNAKRLPKMTTPKKFALTGKAAKDVPKDKYSQNARSSADSREETVKWGIKRDKVSELQAPEEEPFRDAVKSGVVSKARKNIFAKQIQVDREDVELNDILDELKQDKENKVRTGDQGSHLGSRSFPLRTSPSNVMQDKRTEAKMPADMDCTLSNAKTSPEKEAADELANHLLNDIMDELKSQVSLNPEKDDRAKPLNHPKIKKARKLVVDVGNHGKVTDDCDIMDVSFDSEKKKQEPVIDIEDCFSPVKSCAGDINVLSSVDKMALSGGGMLDLEGAIPGEDVESVSQKFQRLSPFKSDPEIRYMGEGRYAADGEKICAFFHGFHSIVMIKHRVLLVNSS